MGKIFLAIMAVLIMATPSFAWDPSGTWGIVGRTDANLQVDCSGRSCSCTFQSAYGKFEATGYVRDNKLVLAYNYLTEVSSNSYGFIIYERKSDNRMAKRTYDLNGKLVGTDNWFKK
ncbi:MAG: hypothetical protein HPY65_17530 [Syntrophaceae bacterium]|nr:hypothetical protein [Syntrophaceae bacterium]